MDWFHAFRTDENQALKDIYRLHRKDCIQFARSKYNLREDDAVDIFQQSVLVLYHNTATGKLTELNSGIKSYLLGIVRLKALETNRSNQKTIYPEDLQSSLADVADAPPEEDPGLTEVIKTLLAQLGNSCRQLLHMYYYKDMNLNEIMSNTDYASVDSIKTQKYKCMKRLQEMLLDHINKKKKLF